MSLMNIINNAGPKIDPCGTLMETENCEKNPHLNLWVI